MTPKRAEALMTQLNNLYPDAKPELDFKSSFELLIAVILSAQCTDLRVNLVTKVLFEQLNKPEDIEKLTLEALETIIKPCGLYKSKAKHIAETCRMLRDRFDGQLPETREAMMTLPGVGRKTANVVISNAFGVPAIAVDTHVLRVSKRIGFTVQTTPDAVEQDLMRLFKEAHWTHYHHVLIFHGRRMCMARKPHCTECPIQKECQFRQKEVHLT